MTEYTLSTIGAMVGSMPVLRTRQNIDKSLMHFVVDTYKVPGGALSVISMKAFFGLMKMDSLIFTPLTRDMPLLSYDRILNAGKETLIAELYDTQLAPADLAAMDKVKESCSDLPDAPKEPRWYDPLLMSPSFRKTGKKLTARLDELYRRWLEQYAAAYERAPECDPEKKRLRAKEYVDGLINNGGPAVDQFKKMLGEEKAEEFLREYVFCVG